MRQKNEIWVGLDIEPNQVQISWFDEAMAEPETIAWQIGLDKYKNPFCLFYNTEKRNFLFGEAALQASEQEEGVLITEIWNNAMLRKRIAIAGQNWTYMELMKIYFERLLLLARTISDNRQPGGLVFTMQTLDVPAIEILQEVSSGLVPEDTPVYLKTYEECFAAYLMNQPQELYSRDSVLLYFKKGMLDIFHLSIGRRYQPYPIQIERKRTEEFAYLQDNLPGSREEKEKLDRDFSKMLQQLFGRALISTVFLIGDGFDGDWLDESLKFLCRGRRVFQGKNLFTKGACYYIMEEKKQRRSYFYRGENHMEWMIRMNVWNNGENEQLMISDGHSDWYQAHWHGVCILDDCQEIILEIFKENQFLERRLERFALDPFPKRPNFSVKVEVDIQILKGKLLRMTVRDLGLGEFYESSGLTWEKEIEL